MPKPRENPFTRQKQNRDHHLTIRLTGAEHEALKAVAGNSRGKIAELIRHGIGLAIEESNARPKR